MSKVAVIGAGPVGGYAASLLAAQGHDVSLYEEHKEIGRPMQCTGLLTSSFDELRLPPKALQSFLVNKTERIELIAPSGRKIEIKQKEYVIDRSRFDEYFTDKAVDNGAKLHLGRRFLSAEGRWLQFKDNGTGRRVYAPTDFVVGADGPNSAVAQQFGIFGQREFFFGVQAVAKGEFDPSAYQAYFGNRFAPGLFAWVVPEDKKTARIGVAVRNNPRQYFDIFFKELNEKCNKKIKIKAWQGGVIPIHDSNLPTEIENKVFLLGDAAAQVKATTLGGIIPGLKAAECLARSMATGEGYEKLWKKRIGQDLWLHLQMRKVMDKLSDKDWNSLIKLMGQEKITSVLEKHDREKPGKILFSSLLKEPRLIQFIHHLF